VCDEGAGRPRGDALTEGDETLSELAGLVDEELDRKTGSQPARRFAAGGVAF